MMREDAQLRDQYAHAREDLGQMIGDTVGPQRARVTAD
jgi:hypothetical protein